MNRSIPASTYRNLKGSIFDLDFNISYAQCLGVTGSILSHQSIVFNSKLRQNTPLKNTASGHCSLSLSALKKPTTAHGENI
jgi:hypothetical protein